MKRLLFLCIALIPVFCFAQPAESGSIEVSVVNEKQVRQPQATVELLRMVDSSLIATKITDSAGKVLFQKLPAGDYLCRISLINYVPAYSQPVHIDERELNIVLPPLPIIPKTAILQEVTVSGRKPFVQLMADKTIVNVEAGITNAGTTIMEVLEKSPGISVDRDGNISLKGRQGVLIMIDNKPTYVGGSDLVNLLNGMSASQVEQIEIMDNPPAKYDAAGNAGIINIRTKKNRQRGINGNISTAIGQGRYPKNNNNIQINYRNAAFNIFFSYSLNTNQYFTNLYALRTYYQPDGKTTEALLEQPFFITSKGHTHNLRTGIDYYIDQKTTLGIAFTGLNLLRKNKGNSHAQWMDAAAVPDSIIQTRSTNSTNWKNAGVNVNGRHVFNASSELTADFDFLGYRISNEQYFENSFQGPGSYTEALQGKLPSQIHIYSGKADYSNQIGSSLKLMAGWKSARITTDNLADYYYHDGQQWQPDLSRSNHFLYAEKIHALYANLDKKAGKWNAQGGLRFEATHYDARQLGNTVVKDSAFSRSYKNLFPTAFISYELDSANRITLSAGKRIDRPAFQKLNPFVFVINKYTFEQGNPYYRPQYTWNIELSHLYKEILNSSLSYSISHDYFSQIFYADTSTGTIVYSEGNLSRMQNFGMSASAQLSLFSYWSLSVQGAFNHKKIEGKLWRAYSASISQFTASMNNQFRLKKGWTAELTAFYISRNQNDVQEVLDPTGQVSAGLSKQVLQNKGSLRLVLRDIFYTQSMQGLTDFLLTREFFTIKRDSRVLTLSFSYRFGKAMKVSRRISGAADEIERVGEGN